jgi:hypothetical protein
MGWKLATARTLAFGRPANVSTFTMTFMTGFCAGSGGALLNRSRLSLSCSFSRVDGGLMDGFGRRVVAQSGFAGGVVAISFGR